MVSPRTTTPSKRSHLSAFFATVILAVSAGLESAYGQGETADASKPSADDTHLQIPSEQARQRERTEEEDPLSKRQADRVDRVDEWLDEPDEFEFYGSARVRYTVRDGKSDWDDGGSRLGLSGQWQYRPRSWLFGRAEAGFKLINKTDQTLAPKGRSKDQDDEVFARLLYAGIESPNLIALAGKNWSTYYQVAGFTDRFESTGGSAGGTYNANTDGGNTGTGRADRVLQTRLLIDFFSDDWWIKPFNLNIQLQHGEPIPAVDGVDYGTAYGLSAILQLLNDYTVGIAYNRAMVTDTTDDRVRAAGIDGDAEALLIGTRWYGERWYVGAVVSRLDNHETTNERTYFDGWGFEVYGSYELTGRWWLIGGWNYLTPNDDQAQAGDYRLNYGVIGARYTLKDAARMFYVELRLDDSRDADGSDMGNVYAAGVRWDFP